MEVGAVKQAFNNEVILLKSKLNQAKIQTIHKLTRKAKTLTEKKAPEQLKEKFKKKAESAVKEVLIIKKIKPRDIAKFIVTHKGQLNEFLNRPSVDLDKACARLLLHKALQDKYKFLRERFSNIAIEDLLMSRLERRKLKKEQREKQKNNKKGKKDNTQAQTTGDWDVTDASMDEVKVKNESDDDLGSSNSHHDQEEVEAETDDEQSIGDNNSVTSENSNDLDLKQNKKIKERKDSIDDFKAEDSDESSDEKKSNEEHSEDENVDVHNDIGAFVKITPPNSVSNKKSVNNTKINQNITKTNLKEKHKDANKNKNLKNKILMKNFNKKESEMTTEENKIVDPFFITATGENYMSLAEPRQPDEIKEVHKQGNRKYRRAVMFGHVPKAKIRRDNFGPQRDNCKFSKFENNQNNFNKNDNFNEFNNNRNKDGKSDEYKNSQKFKEHNNYDNKNVLETKPEKLHPSWEAKKRQSGILPFQGKKILFDDS